MGIHMKKLNSLISLIIILLLAGCATSTNYINAMNSWRGSDMESLIKVWGPPDNSYIAPDGNRVYVYHQQGVETVPYSSYGDGPMALATMETYSVHCTTWFEINKQKRIVRTYAQGNSCVMTDSDGLKHTNPKALPRKTSSPS